MMIRLAFASLVSAFSLVAAAPALAASNADRLHQVAGSAAEFDKARLAGQKAAYFCANCHGQDGNSAYDYIPNLAGQNAVYLLNQIDKFADGRRQDPFMSGLIKLLKEDDRFNMAIYYSSQPVRSSASGNPALTTKGRQLYEGICKACHGAQGYGNEKIARLAGQQPVYLKQALEQYRLGSKRRNDPVMGSIARRLKDYDIAALAAYIPTLK
ncbi:MAG: c-type cytochrome [Gallionellaceae bacterium]|nr:c-type cytochrome [Gallionellaceae bacterium]MDD5364370.1 c-type cytochrome [Gallionellaceae bacterium]